MAPAGMGMKAQGTEWLPRFLHCSTAAASSGSLVGMFDIGTLGVHRQRRFGAWYFGFCDFGNMARCDVAAECDTMPY